MNDLLLGFEDFRSNSGALRPSNRHIAFTVTPSGVWVRCGTCMCRSFARRDCSWAFIFSANRSSTPYLLTPYHPCQVPLYRPHIRQASRCITQTHSPRLFNSRDRLRLARPVYLWQALVHDLGQFLITPSRCLLFAPAHPGHQCRLPASPLYQGRRRRIRALPCLLHHSRRVSHQLGRLLRIPQHRRVRIATLASPSKLTFPSHALPLPEQARPSSVHRRTSST